MPPQALFLAIVNSDLFKLLEGEGDTKKSTMALQAYSTVLALADFPMIDEGVLLPELMTEEERKVKIAEDKGQMKIDSMDSFIEATGPTPGSVQEAQAMASIMKTIIGDHPSDPDEAYSDIGLEVTQRATEAGEVK